jgi:hypothetical protein
MLVLVVMLLLMTVDGDGEMTQMISKEAPRPSSSSPSRD